MVLLFCVIFPSPELGERSTELDRRTPRPSATGEKSGSGTRNARLAPGMTVARTAPCRLAPKRAWPAKTQAMLERIRRNRASGVRDSGRRIPSLSAPQARPLTLGSVHPWPPSDAAFGSPYPPGPGVDMQPPGGDPGWIAVLDPSVLSRSRAPPAEGSPATVRCPCRRFARFSPVAVSKSSIPEAVGKIIRAPKAIVTSLQSCVIVMGI